MWKVTRTENQWFKLFSAFTVLHKFLLNHKYSVINQFKRARCYELQWFTSFFKVKDMPRNIHVILITVVGINLKKK